MIYKVFTVFDTAAAAYLRPFFTQTNALAIRGFKEACNDASHDFCKFPDQYCLFAIGEFDDATAVFTPLPAPMSFGLAQEYKS